MTTAGLDKIDTDLVKKEKEKKKRKRKRKKKKRSQGKKRAHVWKAIFQQPNNYLCDHVSHKWEPWTGIPSWVLPPIQAERAIPYPNSQENGLASIRTCRERVSGTEANGGLNTFHFNGLQQSRLHICNHSFFNLILVSNTFSGPNTSTRCHHLIGRYSMPGLETSDSMCWVFAWIWNESVNLHFRKGILFGKQSSQIFHKGKREPLLESLVVSFPWEGTLLVPAMTRRHLG